MEKVDRFSLQTRNPDLETLSESLHPAPFPCGEGSERGTLNLEL